MQFSSERSNSRVVENHPKLSYSHLQFSSNKFMFKVYVCSRLKVILVFFLNFQSVKKKSLSNKNFRLFGEGDIFFITNSFQIFLHIEAGLKFFARVWIPIPKQAVNCLETILKLCVLYVSQLIYSGSSSLGKHGLSCIGLCRIVFWRLKTETFFWFICFTRFTCLILWLNAISDE